MVSCRGLRSTDNFSEWYQTDEKRFSRHLPAWMQFLTSTSMHSPTDISTGRAWGKDPRDNVPFRFDDQPYTTRFAQSLRWFPKQNSGTGKIKTPRKLVAAIPTLGSPGGGSS